MGTHMKGLSESYPMSTNMTRFRWFSKIFAFLGFSHTPTKVASALEGLITRAAQHSSPLNIHEVLSCHPCALLVVIASFTASPITHATIH